MIGLQVGGTVWEGLGGVTLELALWFQKSKLFPKTLCLLVATATYKLSQQHVCLPAAMFSTVMVMDSPSETVGKLYLNAFFYKSPRLRDLFIAVEKY